MATNEFLEFAGAAGASVLSYAEYAVDAHREIGNQPGLARSTFVNKAMQQTSKIAAVVAQFISDQTAESVLDASDVTTIENQLIAAIEASGFSPDDENEFTAHQKMRGDAKIWRFYDTGASGKEWGIRSDGGNFEIMENTGSEAVPAWTVRFTIRAGGSDVGLVAWFGANAAPTGWLKCNGAAISRTTYAALFTAIGTTFGAGDGSTTFNVPDLRGEFIRGWDDSRGVDSGRVFGSAQADDFKAHTHQVKYDPARLNGGGGGPAVDWGSSLSTTTSTGGAETRPRNIALLACIKY